MRQYYWTRSALLGVSLVCQPLDDAALLCTTAWLGSTYSFVSIQEAVQYPLEIAHVYAVDLLASKRCTRFWTDRTWIMCAFFG